MVIRYSHLSQSVFIARYTYFLHYHISHRIIILLGIECEINDVPANVKFIENNTYNYNDTITYSCIEGYRLIGGDYTRKCQMDKTWTGSSPICLSWYYILECISL